MSAKSCEQHGRSVQPGCDACLDAWGVLIDSGVVLGWVKANEVILLAFPRGEPEDADE
jgi:hypothetical protein